MLRSYRRRSLRGTRFQGCRVTLSTDYRPDGDRPYVYIQLPEGDRNETAAALPSVVQIGNR